jgi:hypothetical protein
MRLFAEIFGWYGAAAIVGAFFLNSYNIVETTDPVYFFLNISGSVGIIIVSMMKRNYQPVALNAVWLVISLGAIWQLNQGL